MRRLQPGIACRAALGLAAAALLTAAVVAQQPAAGDQPAFRAGADLVIVDAVVVDKAGQPVTNLTAADFEVRDEGRAQAISLFQTVSVDAAAQAAGPLAARRYAFSTNAGIGAVPGRAFVLFFDDVHLTQAEGDRAKVALNQFLERELRAGDLVSLVAPGTALRWHARMPDGRPELTRFVNGLRGLYLPDPSADQMSDYEAYRINAFGDEQVADQVERRWKNARVNGREPANLATDQGFQPQNRGGQIGIIPQDILMRAATVYQQAAARNIATLQVLERTIDGLTAVRGRKAVMMLTPGFIADQERSEAKRAIDAARRANVAVYFVDARGLVASTPYAQAQQTGRGLDSRDVGAANAEIALGAEGAAEIAQNTGGFSVRNQNDLGRGLERIGTESRVYYLLGFQPDKDAKAGAFRRLEVKVTRPDVTVRARRGYYAGGLPGAPAAGGATAPRFSDGVDAIDRAAESPYELGAIPLRVADLAFGEASPDSAVVMLVVEADLRAFGFASAGGKLSDVLDLRVLTTELGTNATERYERKVEMSFPEGTRFGPDSWHPLSQEFHLKPGRYQARVAVRDARSGRIGSVTHDFVVPPLTGLRLTTPILTDAIEAPSFGSQSPPKPVLIARRAFPAGATLYYQFSVLGAGKDAAGTSRVIGSHQLIGPGGAVVKQLEPRPVAGGGASPSRFASVGLAGLPAGDYDLVLKVTDQITGQSVERREPLSILPVPTRAGERGPLVTTAFGLALTLSALLAHQAPPARTPASFDTVSASAAAARDAGRLDDAIALYRQGIALRADWDEGRWYLGSSLYERERYREGRDAFAALAARQPSHAGAVGMKGLCEFGLGQHETALRTLLQARSLGIARTPEIAHVVAYHAGILLTRFGEFEVGYAVLTELSGDSVESPKTIEALGLNLLRMPILPSAIPEAKRPLVQLAGRAAFAMGGRRLGDASRLMDELVAAYPREPNVHYARGVLRTTEAPDGALEDFIAELAVSPRHVQARLQIVFELVKRGDAAKARPYAEEAVRLDPQHFAVHLGMGQMWLETGDLPKAIASFERGARLAPGSPQAHFLLARAYARAGRTADAERERAEFRRLEQLKVGQPVERSGGLAEPPK